MDRVLLRFYAATFLFVSLIGIALPLVPQHLTITFGASVTFVGIVAGMHGITQIVLRLPMGDLADRKGRKPSLILAFALTAGAGAFLAFAPSAWWIVPGMALGGLAAGIFWVAANAYLFDRVAPDEIPKAASDYALAIGAALMIGPPLGGAVADRYGFPMALSLILWAGLLGLGLVLTLPETPPPADRPVPVDGVYRRAWRILHHPDIAISAGGTLLFSLLFGTLGAFYPLYLRDLAFTALAIGTLIAVRQGMGLVVRLGMPRALARLGPRVVLLEGVVFSAAALAMNPLATELWSLALLAVAMGAAMGVMIPANLTLVASGAPRDERGLANGIYGTALGIGSAASAWVLGYTGDLFGLAWAFWGAALVAAAGALALSVYARAHGAERLVRRPDGILEEGPAA